MPRIGPSRQPDEHGYYNRKQTVSTGANHIQFQGFTESKINLSLNSLQTLENNISQLAHTPIVKLDTKKGLTRVCKIVAESDHHFVAKPLSFTSMRSEKKLADRTYAIPADARDSKELTSLKTAMQQYELFLEDNVAALQHPTESTKETLNSYLEAIQEAYWEWALGHPQEFHNVERLHDFPILTHIDTLIETLNLDCDLTSLDLQHILLTLEKHSNASIMPYLDQLQDNAHFREDEISIKNILTVMRDPTYQRDAIAQFTKKRSAKRWMLASTVPATTVAVATIPLTFGVSVAAGMGVFGGAAATGGALALKGAFVDAVPSPQRLSEDEHDILSALLNEDHDTLSRKLLEDQDLVQSVITLIKETEATIPPLGQTISHLLSLPEPEKNNWINTYRKAATLTNQSMPLEKALKEHICERAVVPHSIETLTRIMSDAQFPIPEFKTLFETDRTLNQFQRNLNWLSTTRQYLNEACQNEHVKSARIGNWKPWPKNDPDTYLKGLSQRIESLQTAIDHDTLSPEAKKGILACGTSHNTPGTLTQWCLLHPQTLQEMIRHLETLSDSEKPFQHAPFPLDTWMEIAQQPTLEARNTLLNQYRPPINATFSFYDTIKHSDTPNHAVPVIIAILKNQNPKLLLSSTDDESDLIPPQELLTFAEQYPQLVEALKTASTVLKFENNSLAETLLTHFVDSLTEHSQLFQDARNNGQMNDIDLQAKVVQSPNAFFDASETEAMCHTLTTYIQNTVHLIQSLEAQEHDDQDAPPTYQPYPDNLAENPPPPYEAPETAKDDLPPTPPGFHLPGQVSDDHSTNTP